MDIVYASLRRRPTALAQVAGEVAEVLGVLWAHARADDGLEHVSGCIAHDRIDLLLYLLPPDPACPAAPGPAHRATDLLARSHQASPAFRRRYLPPAETTGPNIEDSGHMPA